MASYRLINNKKEECIFCEIANGNIETNYVFWQSPKFIAFLSLFPNTDGLTVLIPKKHYESDVLKMDNKTLNEFILAAKSVSKVLIRHFDDVGRVGLIMEGTGVNHAHIKLFPMHGTQHMREGEWKRYSSHNDTFFNIYEGYISSNNGPMAREEFLQNLAEKLKKSNN